MEFGGVKRHRLIEAIIERIQQAMIEAEAAGDCGLPLPHTSQANPTRGRRQKLSTVVVSAELPTIGASAGRR